MRMTMRFDPRRLVEGLNETRGNNHKPACVLPKEALEQSKNGANHGLRRARGSKFRLGLLRT
jgi:hypothetical protein